MSRKKQKLELTWIGKDERPKLEPRILIEDPELSYHAKERHSDDDVFDNMLIHGDNLLALKALEAKYTGKVKCIYIDPPYNTGNAFDHYDDGIEHSIWLSLMYDRIKILHSLLAKDGIIFVNLDEINHAYMKILMDEVFGLKNFIGDLIWKKRKGGGNDSRYFALDHDYIIVFAKNKNKDVHSEKWRVPQSKKYLKRFKEIDKNGRKYYWDTLARDGLQNPIVINLQCPDGSNITINSQKSRDTIDKELQNGTVRIKKSKNGWSVQHRVYMNPKGQVLRSILDEAGTNKTAGDEIKEIFNNKQSFDYPKPETLIQKILELCTKPGDLVLDSFLGSGTTAAVAHKMKRKWIGIELGQQAITHCAPRLQKAVKGEDKAGISSSVNWQGGGGFRYYHLAPSLLEKDKYGNWVISKKYNATMLAEAVCKNMGFIYDPSQEENEYWRHGHSTETDFIFVTTASMTHSALKKLSEDVGVERTLFVCCKAFNADADAFDNLTIKKIPHAILNKCEWGQDDYSLNVENLPMAKSDAEKEQEKMRDELPLFGQNNDTVGKA